MTLPNLKIIENKKIDRIFAEGSDMIDLENKKRIFMLTYTERIVY